VKLWSFYLRNPRRAGSSFELKRQMRSLLRYSVFLGIDRAGEQHLLAAQMSLEQLDLIQRAGERQRHLPPVAAERQSPIMISKPA